MTIKEIKDLDAARRSLIKAVRSETLTAAQKIQGRLQAKIIDTMVSQLTTVDGRIVANQKNYRLLQNIETVFQESGYPQLFKTVADGALKIGAGNKMYYKKIVPKLDNTKYIDIDNTLKARLGVSKSGEIIKDGFVYQNINNKELQNKTTILITQHIAGEGSMGELTKSLQQLITGTDERAGVVEGYVKTNIFDTYQEIDREYSAAVAKVAGMNYFIYSGSEIEDTRKFCQDRIGKVFKKSDADEWANYNASYISEFPAYNPIKNLGGFNCRHFLVWLPDDVGEKLYKKNNK